LPNRIIKESSRTSITLNQLSDGAERMFWRLTTVADDFGRFEAHPSVLLAQCFPLRVDCLKIKQVIAWFNEMISCGLVTTYVVNGKQLGFFNTWESHQRKRADNSKYPAPTSDNICRQALSNASESSIREARVESESSNSVHGAQPQTWPHPELLIDKYNSETPDETPAVEKITPARIAKAKTYLKIFPQEDFWTGVFAEIKVSSFLRGLRQSNGHAFCADFDWLLTKGKDGTENAVKVYEGKYRNG
jgi:hypothetical protein